MLLQGLLENSLPGAVGFELGQGDKMAGRGIYDHGQAGDSYLVARQLRELTGALAGLRVRSHG